MTRKTESKRPETLLGSAIDELTTEIRDEPHEEKKPKAKAKPSGVRITLTANLGLRDTRFGFTPTAKHKKGTTEPRHGAHAKPHIQEKSWQLTELS
jgi:hypothetical protein